METNTDILALKQAGKSVKRIKGFYNHLQIFVIMLLILALLSNTIIDFFESKITNERSLDWVKANVWVHVLLWFFGIIIHGIIAFRYKISFINNWEKKKVNEIMNQKDL